MTSLACEAALELPKPPVIATIAAPIPTATAAPAAKPVVNPRRRSALTALCSHAEEAAQRDAAAERGDDDRTAQQHDHQGREVDRREVVDELEVLRQRVDDRHLSDPQHADRDRRAGETDDQTLDHERPADEPVRGADEPHDLDLAPTRVDREP